MPDRPEIRIGIAGLGTVGHGVCKHLASHRAELESRTGCRLTLAGVAERNPEALNAAKLPARCANADALALARDPRLQIVCELMGGTGIALQFTRAALAAGKTVVTANKALLSEHGRELFALAAQHGGRIYHEASVAGGIPILKALREGLAANRFPLIYGILNGTCNYILTRMEEEGRPFSEILADARRLGYVEADEALDLDGWDTAHKTVLLAYLAHGVWIDGKRMPVEGIREVMLEDIRLARRLGYRIKLLAEIIRDLRGGHLFASVQPALVPQSMVLASVDGVFNAISVTGDIVGETIYIGRGAGQDATASAVLSDIVDATLALRHGNGHNPMRAEQDLPIAPLERVCRPFYMRLNVKDRPGVLAEIAAVLAEQRISIGTVLQQPGAERGSASLVLTTHSTSERSMRDALAALRACRSVLRRPFILRIADFQQTLAD
jgi:homoserine dehydrogenase